MIITIKRWLSYLWDIQVDYRFSDINGDLVVFLSKGRYQLCTANAIYSFEDRYDNFGNIFRDSFDYSLLKGNKVLILGLGLGSVPITLDMVKPRHWDFTAVEIDDAVCELAALYGYPKIKSPIDTRVGDALIFVKTNRESFDLICLDLFIDDIMPEASMELDFLEDLKSMLGPGGVVVANTLAYTEEHKTKSEAFFKDKFLSVFPDAKLQYTHLNNMLISDKNYLFS